MKITQNIKAIILGLLIAIGAGYVSAWTGPTEAPTGRNVAAPINVGGGDTGNIYKQIKSGDLDLNGITSILHLFTTDLTISSTTNSSLKGRVLASVDDSGRTGWVDTSTLVMSVGGNTTHNIVSYFLDASNDKSQTYTWQIPAGVTTVAIELQGGHGATNGSNTSCIDGGSGGYAKGIYSVNPGDIYTIKLGSSGNGCLGNAPDGIIGSDITARNTSIQLINSSTPLIYATGGSNKSGTTSTAKNGTGYGQLNTAVYTSAQFAAFAVISY